LGKRTQAKHKVLLKYVVTTYGRLAYVRRTLYALLWTSVKHEACPLSSSGLISLVYILQRDATG